VRVTIVGLGYVGLVTAACLSEWGHRVTGLDANASRVRSLVAGRLPFFEPGLDDVVAPNVRGGRLSYTTVDDGALPNAEMVIVAVGTHDGNGGWQTGTMRTCLARVVPLLDDGATLVIRSTLPPEYVRQLPDDIARFRTEVGRGPISAVLNPEFTREGRAIHDFLNPARIVVGVVHDPDGAGVDRVRRLYERVEAPFLVMSAADACLSKLGANLFLATKISFANELAALCEAFGANVDAVVEALGHDQRIGGAFLRSGVGFGGSCLPHQVSMTVRTAQAAGLSVPLLRAVDEINHEQRASFVERMRRLLGGSLADRRIAFLGLAFKPETDDLRDAPSLTIARLLIEAGATVVAYDPMPSARANSAERVPGLIVVDDVTHALEDADAVGIVTEWAEFVELDWRTAAQAMRGRVMVDGRNALDPARMREIGFVYEGFGRRLDMATDELFVAVASESASPTGVAALPS
jgi:UDPglucose 6-dehydrogenase